MINSRVKGAGAEREFANLIFEWTGISLIRNLEQVRRGGVDLLVAPEATGPAADSFKSLAIEIKRPAKTTPSLIKCWWQQALGQANGRTPVLGFRANREEWRIMVPLYLINDALSTDQSLNNTAVISLEGFCMIIRERDNERL